MVWKTLDSPVGVLTLAAEDSALTGLWMASHKMRPRFPSGDYRAELPVFRETELWLTAYFSGSVLPEMPELHPVGTPFQLAVWKLLCKISYGTTTTYGAISTALRGDGIPASPQAVGGAVGRNPISILIPCHRVLGADGSLTGYAGGLEVKRQLLKIEGILHHSNQE